MKCTFLKPLPVNREYTEVFGGYDSRARIADGYFADMQNLSSYAYPLMATRRAREVLMRANGLQGVIVKDKAAWVADGKLYYDGKLVEGLALTQREQSLVSMGARIIIFPDMAAYNTATGEMEMIRADVKDHIEVVETENDIGITSTTEYPNQLEIRLAYIGYDDAKAYQNLGRDNPYPVCVGVDYDGGYGWRKDPNYIPIEGGYAYEVYTGDIDRGGNVMDRPVTRMVYQYTNGRFVPVKSNALQARIYHKKTTGFAGGTVYVNYGWGCEGIAVDTVKTIRLWDRENQAMMLWFDIHKYIEKDVIFELIPKEEICLEDIVWDTWTMELGQSMLRLDGMIENGNRLWGWRYGEAANGETVNEIYSTALGLPAGWNQFEGLPSDSYVVGVGSDGVFTGAAYYSGSMYFFKENCYHRVMGKKPSNYQLVTVTCTGVEIGSEKSLVTAGDALYYKGEDGFYRFDGSIPYKISDVLGDTRYRNAVGGVLGDRIYWDCETDGGRVMLVYDLVHKLWYKESSLCAREMVPAFGNLLVRGEDGLYLVDGENVDARFGEVFVHEGESVFEWFGELGDLGLSDLNAKYVSRIVLRATIEEGARATVSLLRDSEGEWETVAVMNAKRKETASVPITVPRCDHFRIRIEGVGGFKLWGLARDIEKTNEIRR